MYLNKCTYPPPLLKNKFDRHLPRVLLNALKHADLFMLSAVSVLRCLWTRVCFCPHSSWGDGLKLPNCRPSLRRAGASKPISLWRRTTPFEWSALKYCESSLQFLCANVQSGGNICMAWISLNPTWNLTVWNKTEKESWGKSRALESLRTWRIRPSWE